MKQLTLLTLILASWLPIRAADTCGAYNFTMPENTWIWNLKDGFEHWFGPPLEDAHILTSNAWYKVTYSGPYGNNHNICVPSIYAYAYSQTSDTSDRIDPNYWIKYHNQGSQLGRHKFGNNHVSDSMTGCVLCEEPHAKSTITIALTSCLANDPNCTYTSIGYANIHAQLPSYTPHWGASGYDSIRTSQYVTFYGHFQYVTGSHSPIYIDPAGNTLMTSFTDKNGGPRWDFYGLNDGTLEQMSWSTSTATGYWLMLDRANTDSRQPCYLSPVNTGCDNALTPAYPAAELFGRNTPPMIPWDDGNLVTSSVAPYEHTGWKALERLAKQENPNATAVDASQTPILYSQLRLIQGYASIQNWTLAQKGVTSIGLQGTWDGSSDGKGNVCGWRGTVTVNGYPQAWACDMDLDGYTVSQ